MFELQLTLHGAIMKIFASLFLLGLSGISSAQDSRESVPSNEQASIESTVSIMEAAHKAAHKPGEIMRRDAHAKHHGCVKATFEVNKNLPAELSTGVFQADSSYDAWIRFSNGNGGVKDDREGDGRGMAIKLLNVPGDKLLDDEPNTQDFLMINHPVFFVRNAADYVEFSTAVTSGKPLSFFFPGVNPLNWRGRELSIGRAIRGKEVTNPLATSYFSMTPYAFGESLATKYEARPCYLGVDKGQERDSAHHLRSNMMQTLSKTDACFEFYVQIRKNPRKEPVEDPTVEWTSPFRKVATIKIPKQIFATAEQDQFCENLTMTPWHALPAHKPLGGINRVRKVVYETISKLRHETNGVDSVEPN
jgi:hypothetical protein